jgi:uncharacterized protein YbjT (DUF2867 family)
MNVLIYGATGMIGKGALLVALDDPKVTKVTAVVRRPLDIKHDKLRELTVTDFMDYREVDLSGQDACLYCLGISSSGMSEEDYTRITLDFTVAAMAALHASNPKMAICFISGAGTDASSSTVWKRVKGQAEQAVTNAGFSNATLFRPGGIKPREGVKSGVASYRFAYAIVKPFWPLLLKMPKYVTDSDVLARAMLRAARDGAPKTILESEDINALGS